MEKQEITRILDGWNDFSLRESISATTLKLQGINQFLTLPFQDVRETEDSVVFDFNNETKQLLGKEFLKKKEGKLAEVYLFFPILHQNIQGKQVGLPLFAFHLNDQKQNILHSKTLSFNPFEGTDIIIMKDIFQNKLGIPEEELPDERNLIDFMNSLSGSLSFTFEKSFSDFCHHVNEITNFKISPIGILHEGTITYEHSIFSKQMRLIQDAGLEFSPLAQEYIGATEKDVLIDNTDTWIGSYNDEHPLGEGQAKVLTLKGNNNIIPVEGAPGTGKTTLMLSSIAEHLTSNIYHGVTRSDYNAGIITDLLSLVVSSSNKAVENIEESFQKDPFLKDRKDFYLSLGNNEKINEAIKKIDLFMKDIENKFFNENHFLELKSKMETIVSNMEDDYVAGATTNELFLKQQSSNNEKTTHLSTIETLQNKKDEMQNSNESYIFQLSFKELVVLVQDVEKSILLNEEIRRDEKHIGTLNRKIKREDIYLQSLIESIKDDPLYHLYKKFSYENIEREFENLKRRKDSSSTLEETPLFAWSIDSAGIIVDQINQSLIKTEEIPFFYIEFFFNKRNNIFKSIWKKNSKYLSTIGFSEESWDLKKSGVLLSFFKKINDFKKDPIYKIKIQNSDIWDIEYLVEKINEIETSEIKKKTEEVRIQTAKKNMITAQELIPSFKPIPSLKLLKWVLNIEYHLVQERTSLSELEEEELNKKRELSYCSIFDICRTKHIKQNRELFELSIMLLSEYRLKYKDQILFSLDSLKQMVSGTGTEAGKLRTIWNGKEDDFYSFISLVFPVLTTTIASFSKIVTTFHSGFVNASGNWVSWNKYKTPPVSLLLSDESGMTKSHSLFPLLYYSKKAIIVGDQNQLEPIIAISENEIEDNARLFFEKDSLSFSPGLGSSYSRAAGQTSLLPSPVKRSILLEEHRRCQPDIANIFIDIVKGSYLNLKICTLPLSAERKNKIKKMGGKNNLIKDVKGSVSSMNVNSDEIEAIEDILGSLEDAGYNLSKDVGIISPYRGQARAITKRFGNRLNHSDRMGGIKKIGTVHSFQGAEFEVIILSTVITKDKSPRFINGKKNLLNVSISRAKDLLIVVGDVEKLENAGGYANVVISRMKESGIFL